MRCLRMMAALFLVLRKRNLRSAALTASSIVHTLMSVYEARRTERERERESGCVCVCGSSIDGSFSRATHHSPARRCVGRVWTTALPSLPTHTHTHHSCAEPSAAVGELLLMWVCCTAKPRANHSQMRGHCSMLRRFLTASVSCSPLSRAALCCPES